MSQSEPSKAAQTESMLALMEQLFPYHRSLTGEGVRQTLNDIQHLIPLKIESVPSGTDVFDWQIPQEWKIRDAYIEDRDGRRLVDYVDSNLHVMNYSTPVSEFMSWLELKPHVHSLAERPGAIPYKTAYFQDTWGFCVNQEQRLAIESASGPLKVRIDSEMFDGVLNYAECFLPGKSDREVLISCHICHPSLANDNLSGIAIATHLAQWLQTRSRYYSYRFIFAPATLGAITWLHQRQSQLDRVSHGLVLSLLGDAGNLTYKRSQQENSDIDRVVEFVLEQSERAHQIRPFTPNGYDERQFCSPGFNLPMGCLMRTPNGEYPQYHNSDDNLGFIDPDCLSDSLIFCQEVVQVLESNHRFQNLSPYGEPRLGTRNLFCSFSHSQDRSRFFDAVLWVLNQSDGEHDLLTIAKRSGLEFSLIVQAVDSLLNAQLLSRN